MSKQEPLSSELRVYLEEAMRRLVSLARQGRCKCQATSGYTHHCEKCRALAWVEKTKEEIRDLGLK